MRSGSLIMTLLILLVGRDMTIAQEPVRSVWLISSGSGVSERVARIRPEVHSVRVEGDDIEIGSAGTSLHYFGPLQTAPANIERARQLRFRLPLHPRMSKGRPVSIGPDVIGVLITGVPIYNQFLSASWNERNIWHFDPIAAGDDGSRVATGRPRASLTHQTALGLLEPLIADGTRHSPIIGYALDGYPIYGPWTESENGERRRVRSGYRLRHLTRRNVLPDGTRLLPGQEGPDVAADYPLGTFVEDYEFVPDAGDLDRFNGRMVVTPEYPQGTYAYFLTTDESGRLAFPYLLAGQYRGDVTAASLRKAFRDLADQSPTGVENGRERTITGVSGINDGWRLSLLLDGEATSGSPMRLGFVVESPRGEPVRSLEHVHERPLHLLVVSEDLAEFAHIHPEPAAGDRHEVWHTFQHGGRYRLYADYTPPGGPQRVVSFALKVGGRQRQRVPLPAAGSLNRQTNGVGVSLAFAEPPRAGAEIGLTLRIRDANGRPPESLEPWLGAWSHLVLIDPRHRAFIHAHPLDESGWMQTGGLHTHSTPATGAAASPPEMIRSAVIFPFAGKFKLWVQFQLAGAVIIEPFVIDVAPPQPGDSHSTIAAAVPSDARKIVIGAGGFSPAEIEIEADRPTRLVLTRESRPNCGGRIVIPALNLQREIPLGGSVVIELPPLPAGPLQFGCGMGMYRGVIIARQQRKSQQ